MRRRDSLAFSETEFVELRDHHDGAAAELRAAELGERRPRTRERCRARARRSRPPTRRAPSWRAPRSSSARSRASAALHDELDRAFTDLRTDLNQALRPELSELASRYIRELTDGRYTELELDDQYNIIVLEDGVPKPVISGGEEDLANLVLRLAISEMIAERAGQAFSLLILDEVFGSLDETRRHNVVELLRRLQDRFEQVILITHIESVREGLDRVVTVRYDEESGTSRVERGGAPPAPATRRSRRCRPERRTDGDVSRSWRPHRVDGPYRARVDDIGELNQVFSDAFTERYRRDGMVGVRVPFLNPAIWRYAIEDAADGAMLWRDERGDIAAFNMVHRSGAEGLDGPARRAHRAAGQRNGKGDRDARRRVAQARTGAR